VGGVRDVVSEGLNGYSYESGDIPALVEGVRRIAADRNRIAQMGLAARAFAETQTWDSMMDEVIMHYQQLMRTN
jgi:glycosyltransferase involved in cell wall biosynthesis